MTWQEIVALDDRLKEHMQAAILATGRAGELPDWGAAVAAAWAAAGLPRGAQTSAPPAGAAVAVIPVEGGLFGRQVAEISRQLRAAVADPGVKAIVLDVNSPGGSVYGIDELAAEIYAARSEKRIVAQVRPLAASAAYYLASQAHEIAATPTAELGSIGVWMMHVDFSEMLAKDGVKVTLISAGKYKTEGNPFGPLDDDARGFLESRVGDYYQMFLEAVARGRGASVAAVRSGFGEGRVVGARQAVHLGMADRVATMEETLRRLEPTQVVMPAAAAASAGGSAETPIAASTDVHIPATAERNTEEKSMPEPTTTTTEASAVAQEQATRAAQIVTLAQSHGCPAKAADWIKSGKSLEAIQAEILASYEGKAAPLPAGSAGVHVTVDEQDKRPKGEILAAIARSLAACRGNQRDAVVHAKETLKDPAASRWLAMGASTGSAGGFIVPEQLSSDFIELLGPLAAVRSLNPVLAPLVNGALTLSGMAAGATAGYIGEQQNVPKKDVTLRQVKAAAKKLAALVPISNDLLRYASGRADVIVRDDLLAGVAVAEDSAFIRGAGTAYTPKGLRQWAGNTTAANATVNLANVTADLSKLKGYLEDSDVRMLRPGWIGHPRTFRYLEFVRDGNGNFAFPEIKQGQLLGYPFRKTTTVPKNLGGGTDESELYLCDFADVVICDVPMMVLETSSEAAYDDGGTVRSAFSRDETVVKVIVEHDLFVRHAESVAYLSAVKWS